MEENKKQTVEMTAEEAEAFKQFQEKQAKEKAAKKRKEDREAYAQLVDSEIESAIHTPSPIQTERCASRLVTTALMTTVTQ